MLTLRARIEAAAGGPGAVTFVTSGDADRVPWGQLHDEALAMAAALQARGVMPGDHVGLLGPTTRPLVTCIQAVWLTGATLVMLPLPMRLGSIEEFVAQTRCRILNADVALLVVDPDLAPFVDEQPGDPPIVLLSDLAGGPGRRSSNDYDRPVDDPDALAVLQFTSGSTADPKGVMLPHRTVCANLDAVMVASEIDPRHDVLVSWLPLYHDMGLVGFAMLPMTTGTDLVLGAPQDFLGAPARWMEWLSDFGGTATAGPNFSWVLATRALRNHAPARPLAAAPRAERRRAGRPRQRRALCRRRRRARHARRGRVPRVRHGRGRHRRDVPRPDDRPAHRRRRPPCARDRVATPPPRPSTTRGPAASPSSGARCRASRCGSSTRVDGSRRLEREVGELEIRGTSVTPGYYKRPDATEAAFRDDWLRTGDLAYLLDGELVICGRIKDLIIVGGRNVFPEDVERAVASIDGVRAGNVIAFGVEGRAGKEGVVVVAESKSDDPTLTRRSVADRVARDRRPARPRHRPRRAGLATQDVLRQAPTVAVPRALPQRGSRARVGNPASCRGVISTH